MLVRRTSLLAGLVLFLLPFLPLLGGCPAARAAALPPGQTRSHYLTTVDVGTLRAAGRSDAVDAQSQGMADALVVLDAGSPAGADGSVRLPDGHRRATPAQVTSAVTAYGKAWLAAKGPSLVLVVGVTNYGQWTGGQHGAAWARIVDAVSRGLPGIDVRGGLDAEQEWSGPDATLAWVDAYDASGARPYVDFGSCTCPPLPASPPNGWTTEDVYAAAVGDGRAVVLPEIYATRGGNSRAWARVVQWSREQHPQLPVRLVGALTELGACTGPPARSCPGIDLAPQPAWSQLTSALGVTDDAGSDLRYLTDISYLPTPTAAHHRGIAAPLLIALLVLVGAVVSTAVVSEVRRRR